MSGVRACCWSSFLLEEPLLIVSTQRAPNLYPLLDTVESSISPPVHLCLSSLTLPKELKPAFSLLQGLPTSPLVLRVLLHPPC